MLGYLIDTNIIIYRLKNLGNVNSNFRLHQNDNILISVITYGELIYGAEKSNNRSKNLLTAYQIRNIFPILDITAEVMEVFGKVKSDVTRNGRPIDDMDLLIAATAISNDLTLVTHNLKHFGTIQNLTTEDWY